MPDEEQQQPKYKLVIKPEAIKVGDKMIDPKDDTVDRPLSDHEIYEFIQQWPIRMKELEDRVKELETWLEKTYILTLGSNLDLLIENQTKENENV